MIGTIGGGKVTVTDKATPLSEVIAPSADQDRLGRTALSWRPRRDTKVGGTNRFTATGVRRATR
ncbi:hypothetical protein [Microvirga terricola]|uniref:Uncharacterized protein n=1 Tax=Microvirga terricola TaxID=2719797 RepID=A0ABX0V7V7_9HYPH|nr:hypothetical protein [Microvirga terricola]NIX75932.1 hypothetical protein [Microvirga terricola]